MFKTILEATALVVLIIMIFLHSVRASLIPIVTIPVSLITAFAIMYAAGLTVNTLTLLAMVLAIGLVVDDAIVMLENIYRHIEEGMKPYHAAIKGSREIAFAIVAMTMTLAAVYAPIAFTPGRTGRLFLEFALTLAGAVVISGFVALTLTPMMCSKLLKHSEKRNFFARLIEGTLDGLERGYRGALRLAVKGRWLVLLIALGVAGGGGFIFTQLKSELSPTEDRGTIIVSGSAPEGASYAYTKRYAEQVEEILAQRAGTAVLSDDRRQWRRGHPLHLIRPDEGLERARCQPAADRAEDPAAIAQGGGRPGFGLQSRLARRARLRQAVPVRHPVVGELRGIEHDRQCAGRRSSRTIRASPISIPTCGSTSRRSRSRSIATASPIWGSIFR